MYILQSPRNEVARLHLELAPLPADDERDVRVGARGQQERERGARRTQGVLKERDKGPTTDGVGRNVRKALNLKKKILRYKTALVGPHRPDGKLI